ncbi:TonB-dependent copper receptor [Dyella acidiphila]|uniref:TonB-dependent copper receptor n=1 Tax=Dyella acidiphila TaxID=2775866 RepID=A0ABR9GE06_9GAMM|nr:TonB-dependent copper receptor [Dyella acidiphila]MBE1162246.1 TonB-dependent copper receptor [Dyella acidiphila]
MHCNFFARPLAVASGLAWLSCAHATDTPPADSPQALAPVVVTANFQQSPLTTVLDPKAPRQPIPASDAADLLKTVPGFAVMRKGGSNGDAVFRGMAGSRLAISVDGTQLAGGCPARMDPPTAYISPALYDKVTIIKGPETVVNGPVGSAGTVLFEHDTPHYSDAAATLDASTTFGSFGRNDQSADFKGGTPDFYVNVDGNRTASGDYRDGDSQRVHSRYARWNVNTAIGWTPDADTLLELSAGTGNGQAAYAFSSMDGVKFLRRSVALRFEREHLSEHWRTLQAKLYRNDVDHVMDNYTLRQPDPGSMMPMAMASELRCNTAGARVAADFDWNDLSLEVGLDGATTVHDARTGGPAGSALPYPSLPHIRDARLQNLGAFAEATWHASTKDRVIAGARIDRASARAYTIVPAASRSANLPSGFVRLERDLASPATFYLGLGHSERFPDYWELFGQHVDTAPGFRHLRPERTSQLDAGWQYHGSRLKAWVSAYAGSIDDYILIHYGSQQGYASNVRAQIAGGEAGAEYAWNSWWKTSATLAYAWGQDTTEHRPLPQMPPLETRLAVDWDNGSWSAGALWRLAARQDRVALGEGTIVGQDLGPSGGFGVFSLHGGWRISQAWSLSAGVDNLLDKTYAEHISPSVVELQGFTRSTRVNEPGRVAWVKLALAL